MAEVLTAEAAARLIRSGQTLTVCGVVGGMVPERVLGAIGARFQAEGAPRDLTLVFPVASGDVFDLPGMDHLAQPGLTRRMIGGSWVIGRNPRTGRRARATE